MKNCLVVLIFLIHCSAYSALLSISMEDKPGGRVQKNTNGEYEICWFGSRNSETSLLRRNIENFFTEQMTTKVGLKLKFYDDCLLAPNPFSPIGIGFYDASDNTPAQINQINFVSTDNENAGHPTTYSKGFWTNHDIIEIVLTSHFVNVHKSLQEQSAALTPQGKHNLLLSISLHELLHAFGFEHEQDRPDSLCLLGKSNFYKSIHTLIGDYDAVSIMNYCLTHSYKYNESVIELSEGDVAALKQIYLK